MFRSDHNNKKNKLKNQTLILCNDGQKMWKKIC